MTQTDTVAFVEKMSEDDSLKREWNQCETTAQCVSMAERLGFDVEASELEEIAEALGGEQAGELDEDQLARVAGGLVVIADNFSLNFEEIKHGGGILGYEPGGSAGRGRLWDWVKV